MVNGRRKLRAQFTIARLIFAQRIGGYAGFLKDNFGRFLSPSLFGGCVFGEVAQSGISRMRQPAEGTRSSGVNDKAWLTQCGASPLMPVDGVCNHAADAEVVTSFDTNVREIWVG